MTTIVYSELSREWWLPDGIHKYRQLKAGQDWMIWVENSNTGVQSNVHRINSRELAALAKSKELAMKHYKRKEE